jgi:hypothetical protein
MEFSGYKPKDIFHAYETDIFFNTVPQMNTFWYRRTIMPKGKKNKEIMTTPLYTKLERSEKLPSLVVGNTTSYNVLSNNLKWII